MIISRTPFRVSFFGGGTDYPAWYRTEGGAVLSTTIDKYCYLSCRYLPPFFSHKHRVVWSHVEAVSSIAEILHPAVREGLRAIGFDDSVGLEIQHQGDLPARAGMGSSSSFVVGLLKVLTTLKGCAVDKRELAVKAIDFEQNVLKEAVGCQDQIAAAYGGFNLIEFYPGGDFHVRPLALAPARLQDLQSRMLLVYSGTSRLASEIASGLIPQMRDKARELREIRRLVDRGLDVLIGGRPLDELGELLHQGWMLKRALSPKIANPAVDRIYNLAITSGALGGKLLGAGASGFLMFYVPDDRRALVLNALADFLCVSFNFEHEGSKIVYNGYDAAHLALGLQPPAVAGIEPTA